MTEYDALSTLACKCGTKLTPSFLVQTTRKLDGSENGGGSEGRHGPRGPRSGVILWHQNGTHQTSTFAARAPSSPSPMHSSLRCPLLSAETQKHRRNRPSCNAPTPCESHHPSVLPHDKRQDRFCDLKPAASITLPAKRRSGQRCYPRDRS